MATTVLCRRCQREAAALDALPPLPAELADEVVAKVCADCWKDWEAMEVMVINEHRLNFMDPEAPAILQRHLREFLALDAPSGDG
ncbi:MAG: Fe(2+)-trafficking protein [Acidobacteriota bacterium]|nr:Fe(2+)-trafficking protein [Acidobacteriota bacterium]